MDVEYFCWLMLVFAIAFVIAVAAIVNMPTAAAGAVIALVCVALFAAGVIFGANGWG